MTTGAVDLAVGAGQYEIGIAVVIEFVRGFPAKDGVASGAVHRARPRNELAGMNVSMTSGAGCGHRSEHDLPNSTAVTPFTADSAVRAG